MYTVLASDVTSGVDFGEMLEPIMTSINGAISPTDIVTLLGAGVAFGVPFFLALYGVRKIVRIAQSAIKNGSIRV